MKSTSNMRTLEESKSSYNPVQDRKGQVKRNIPPPRSGVSGYANYDDEVS